MSTPAAPTALRAVAELALAAADAVEGTPTTMIAAVEIVLDLIVTVIGPEQAKTLVDEAAVRAADAAADAAEIAKFGST